ncbi:MAG: hypothetical protein ACJ73E_12645 [Mycobacteriales bacterium]
MATLGPLSWDPILVGGDNRSGTRYCSRPREVHVYEELAVDVEPNAAGGDG